MGNTLKKSLPVGGFYCPFLLRHTVDTVRWDPVPKDIKVID